MMPGGDAAAGCESSGCGASFALDAVVRVTSRCWFSGNFFDRCKRICWRLTLHA